MYAGTTFRLDSGRIVGVHQKIDRIARKHLDRFLDDSDNFPKIDEILHFEGKNGPDGLKRKCPSQDEPAHFIDPNNLKDRTLLDFIEDHIFNLSEALKNSNKERAGFEAAWLAHAVVDGLTPAHHSPLNARAEEMITNADYDTLEINEITDILYLNRREVIIKKMKYWGMGGMVSHVLFEGGVTTAIISNGFKDTYPRKKDIKNVVENGFEVVFLESLQKVNRMHMYDEFIVSGWTRALAMNTKKILLPEIIKMVTLAWYQAKILSEAKS